MQKLLFIFLMLGVEMTSTACSRLAVSTTTTVGKLPADEQDTIYRLNCQ